MKHLYILLICILFSSMVFAGEVTVTLEGTNPLTLRINGRTVPEEAMSFNIYLYYRDDGTTDLSLSNLDDDQLAINWGWGVTFRALFIQTGSWLMNGHTFTRRAYYGNAALTTYDDYWLTTGVNALVFTFSAIGNGHAHIKIWGDDGLADFSGVGHTVYYVNQTVELDNPLPPEINIKQGNMNISNYGLYSFPYRDIGHSKDQVMTIENLGAADLTITTPLNVTGSHADQFSILSQPGASTIPPGNSTTFTVRFLPTSSGQKTARIEIANNDTDENPYVLRLVGNGDQYCLITCSDPSEGGITTPPDTSYHDYGTLEPITAIPNSDYRFTYWSGDVEDSTSASTTVTMNQDQRVTAHFESNAITDTTCPLIVYCYPADGSVSIPKNTPIQFMIDDAGEGVDIFSLNAWVNDMSIITDGTAVSGGVTFIQQLSSSFNVIYIPETPFIEGSTVTACFTCSDLGSIPNPCDTTWSFTIGHTVLDTATAMAGILGPDGGTLHNEALNVTLTFPEGALENSVLISITAADSLPPLPEGQTGLGLPYHFGPDGLVANEPILAAIPYTQADLDQAGVSDPADLTIFYLHSTSGEWIQLTNAYVDEVKQLIYVVVTEFCLVTLSGNIGTEVPEADMRPLSFSLYQNYPNPFNPETHIGFNVAESCRVVLKVYNLLGHEVAALVNEMYQPGKYDVTFNAAGMASGIYVYKIQMGQFADMKKMTLFE